MQGQRRTFIVDRQLQGALGWRIAIHWMIYLTLSIIVTCVLQVLSNFDQGNLWSRIEGALKAQIGSIAALLALLPWFVHDLLKFSNRFAAPVVRLQRSIVQLTKQAQAPRLVFRSGDFWHQLANDFNELRVRVEAEREQLAQATIGNRLGGTAVLPTDDQFTNWQEPNTAAIAESKR